MRRTAPFVFVALLSACALSGSEPDMTTVVDTAEPPVESTTSTTEAPSTTTSLVGDELTTTSCPAPDSDFAPLCEAYDLIVRNYVDPVDTPSLADAALLGVQSLATAGTSPGPLTCPIPHDAFVRVCEELEALDVGADALESILYGMAEFGLDPNSTYITPEALALIQEEQEGSVEGIGALVTTEDQTSDDPENTTCNIVSETCPLVIVL
jgi:hypothetical protein